MKTKLSRWYLASTALLLLILMQLAVKDIGSSDVKQLLHEKGSLTTFNILERKGARGGGGGDGGGGGGGDGEKNKEKTGSKGREEREEESTQPSVTATNKTRFIVRGHSQERNLGHGGRSGQRQGQGQGHGVPGTKGGTGEDSRKGVHSNVTLMRNQEKRDREDEKREPLKAGPKDEDEEETEMFRKSSGTDVSLSKGSTMSASSATSPTTGAPTRATTTPTPPQILFIGQPSVLVVDAKEGGKKGEDAEEREAKGKASLEEVLSNGEKDEREETLKANETTIDSNLDAFQDEPKIVGEQKDGRHGALFTEWNSCTDCSSSSSTSASPSSSSASSTYPPLPSARASPSPPLALTVRVVVATDNNLGNNPREASPTTTWSEGGGGEGPGDGGGGGGAGGAGGGGREGAEGGNSNSNRDLVDSGNESNHSFEASDKTVSLFIPLNNLVPDTAPDSLVTFTSDPPPRASSPRHTSPSPHPSPSPFPTPSPQTEGKKEKLSKGKRPEDAPLGSQPDTRAKASRHHQNATHIGLAAIKSLQEVTTKTPTITKLEEELRVGQPQPRPEQAAVLSVRVQPTGRTTKSSLSQGKPVIPSPAPASLSSSFSSPSLSPASSLENPTGMPTKASEASEKSVHKTIFPFTFPSLMEPTAVTAEAEAETGTVASQAERTGEKTSQNKGRGGAERKGEAAEEAEEERIVGETDSRANIKSYAEPFPLTTQSQGLTTSKQPRPESTVVAEVSSASSLPSPRITDDEKRGDAPDKGRGSPQPKESEPRPSSDATTASTSTTTATSGISLILSTEGIEEGEGGAGEGPREGEEGVEGMGGGIEGESEVDVDVGETDIDGATDEDDTDSILPHHRCPEERVIDVNWNLTDAGVLALRPCPIPYTGSVYRPCYSSGAWGTPDYTECRLPHLREIQNLIFYHVHKHLVDGLYPLAEELSRLVTSDLFPIKSPMDRLDAIDALNAILRAKIKIRIDEEENKDIGLITALIATADQLLTRIKVTFSVETEKNALITMKSAETIFGLRLLSENVLRALIVSCNEGTVRRIRAIHPNTKNIIMSLTHRTPYGSLIPLLSPTNNNTSQGHPTDIPQAIVHLEDFKKLGVGISFVWIRDLGPELNTQKYELISDIILVSVVPAVSIQVDFEETPTAEIEIKLKRHFSPNDVIRCGRIKSPRELWGRSECQVLSRNATSIRCLCSEMGAIGAIHQKSLDSSFGHNHSSFHFNRLIISISCSISLIFLLVSLFCQLFRNGSHSREASFILINLLSALGSIQVIFLLGGPFPDAASYSSSPGHFLTSVKSLTLLRIDGSQVCNFSALVLHYIHLVSGFWMLSHTIYLYQRLWRPVSTYSSSSSPSSSPLPFSDLPFADSPSPSPSCWSCCFCRMGSSQWDSKRFSLLSWIVPLFILVTSYQLNPNGYETKRYCWMSIEGGMVYSFIVPVSLLIMINTVVMLLVLKRFFAHKPITHKIEIEKTQPSLRAGVTLLPFFAVNWFLSVLALEDTATTIFQYIFAISNAVQSFLVFLFLFYQNQEVNQFLKSRIFGQNKRAQKSILKLKKNHHHSCRGVRVDIPRLYVGSEGGSNGFSSAAAGCSADTDRCCNSSDSQPLLMPYSSQSQAFDPSQPSTSSQGMA